MLSQGVYTPMGSEMIEASWQTEPQICMRGCVVLIKKWVNPRIIESNKESTRRPCPLEKNYAITEYNPEGNRKRTQNVRRGMKTDKVYAQRFPPPLHPCLCVFVWLYWFRNLYYTPVFDARARTVLLCKLCLFCCWTTEIETEIGYFVVIYWRHILQYVNGE